MQQPTFDFLRKMQQTYLTDFVVSKHNVQDNDKLTETNVINYLETCFNKIKNDIINSLKHFIVIVN